MSSDTAPHDQTSGKPPTRRGVPWLPVGAVLTVVLAVAGANAPARIKWIGLFAVIFGLVSGGMLGLLARDRRGTISWKTVLLAGLLVAAGEVLMGIESHRIFAARYAMQFRRHQTELMTAEALRGNPSGAAEKTAGGRSGRLAGRARILEHALDENTRFSTYLQLRVSALGTWPSPWPMVFWIGEVIAGSLSGVWLFCRLARGERPSRSVME